jgi:GxxExxY protein
MDIHQQEEIGKQIVDSAVKVHRELGPGLLESAYQACLAYELKARGIAVACEVPQPVQYGAIRIDCGYRIDMIIEDCILVENKTVDQILPIHQAQILTYLKLRKCSLGFLINWNVLLIKNGIKRVVNNHYEKLP